MDIVQFQPIVERILRYILTQSPDNIEQFKQILEMIGDGSRIAGAIGVLVTQYPELSILANKLLSLILSGGSIQEIATVLINFAGSLQISIEVVIQLLQIIGGMLAAF